MSTIPNPTMPTITTPKAQDEMFFGNLQYTPEVDYTQARQGEKLSMSMWEISYPSPWKSLFDEVINRDKLTNPKDTKVTASWKSVPSYTALVDLPHGTYHVVDATVDGVEAGISALYTWIALKADTPEVGSWVRVCCFMGTTSANVPLPANYRSEPCADPYQVKRFVDTFF